MTHRCPDFPLQLCKRFNTGCGALRAQFRDDDAEIT